MKRTSFRRVAAASLAGLALISAASFGLILAAVLRCAASDERVQADAILVLGAAVWPGERPSPILLSRIQTAVELYQQGYAEHMILSGGLGQYPPAEAEVMRRVAMEQGVPEEALFLEATSHSTLENVRRSAKIMQANGWESVIIVSDPYHLYRVCQMARDQGLEAHPVAAADSPGWTIPRLRAYYTVREVLAVVAYQAMRLVQ